MWISHRFRKWRAGALYTFWYTRVWRGSIAKKSLYCMLLFLLFKRNCWNSCIFQSLHLALSIERREFRDVQNLGTSLDLIFEFKIFEETWMYESSFIFLLPFILVSWKSYCTNHLFWHTPYSSHFNIYTYIMTYFLTNFTKIFAS